jgi:membrane protease YdiL (CAAX protease family)
MAAIFAGRRLARADVAFAVLCIAALLVCLGYGDWADAAECVALAAVSWPLFALTRTFTSEAPKATKPRHPLLAALVVAVVLCLSFAEQSGASGWLLRLWEDFHWGATALVRRAITAGDAETVNAAITYAVIPVAVLTVLGWRRADFGAGNPGPGTAKTLLLWSSLPIIAYAVAIFLGHATLSGVAERTMIDVFRNGFTEEILFRGIVLRLAGYAFGLKTGNVVQALCFGFWHYGANLRDVHGNPIVAVADGICTQALFGYVQGLLTLRTRNVLVAGCLHSLLDAARAIS